MKRRKVVEKLALKYKESCIKTALEMSKEIER